MFYEVFIPSNGDEGFDVTITVEADNWMTALKSGLERTGQGAESIRNVMCDIKDDNSIHVTDASTRRVFVLREVDSDEESGPTPPGTNGASTEAAEAATEGTPENIETQKMAPLKPGNHSRPGRAAPPPEAAPPPRATPRSGTASVSSAAAKADAAKKALRQSGSHPPPVGTAPPPGSGPNAPTQKFEPVRKSGPPAGTSPPQSNPAEPSEEPSAPAQEPSAPAAQEPSAPAAQEPSAPAVQAESAPAVDVQPELAPQDETPDPNDDFGEEGAGLAEHSWTSEDKRMRIGSSTFEALRRDEPEPKVVRETRAPSGQREAVDIGRAKEAVSQNVLEEVFLEIQQIHEQGMTMEQVINFVMDLSMEKIGAEAGSIMFADVNGRELYFATARGPKAHEVMDFRVPMSKGIVGFCAREGVSLAISDAENDPRFYRKISEALGYETRSVCCAPIQFEGRVYGVIELMNKEGAFTNTEVNVLTYIGRQLAKFVHDLIMSREKLEG